MPLATREIHGLRLEILGRNDGIVIHSGRCRDIDDQRDISVAIGETVRVDSGRVGLGGLDTGTMQPSTSYAVYLVRQGNDTEGMISKAFDSDSADPPAFPNDGSLAYRRIGAVATDAQGRILVAQQEGDDEHRRYRYQEEPPTLVALREGPAVEFTPFDLAPLFNRHATRALIAVQPGNGISVTVSRDPGGTAATSFEAPATITFEAVEGDAPTVGYYRNARVGGSATITVLGFEETL